MLLLTLIIYYLIITDIKIYLKKNMNNNVSGEGHGGGGEGRGGAGDGGSGGGGGAGAGGWQGQCPEDRGQAHLDEESG